LLIRTSTDLVQTALALGRLEAEGWVFNNAGWWEVLGRSTEQGYGFIDGNCR